jgi:hypothetical protein
LGEIVRSSTPAATCVDAMKMRSQGDRRLGLDCWIHSQACATVESMACVNNRTLPWAVWSLRKRLARIEPNDNYAINISNDRGTYSCGSIRSEVTLNRAEETHVANSRIPSSRRSIFAAQGRNGDRHADESLGLETRLYRDHIQTAVGRLFGNLPSSQHTLVAYHQCHAGLPVLSHSRFVRSLCTAPARA